MIANCGSDERKKYSGGQAGDQTGKEFAVIEWYSRPWRCVLRYPDQDIGIEIATLARASAHNNHIGYDQSERLTFYSRLKEVNWNPALIMSDCEADCSSSTAALIIAAGYRKNVKELVKVSPSLTTSCMRKALQRAGFEPYEEKRFLTSDNYLLPGDILLNDGHHVAINLDEGSRARINTFSITSIALEVIDGKWGNDEHRKRTLTAAGWNYTEVQAEVNRLIRGGAR